MNLYIHIEKKSPAKKPDPFLFTLNYLKLDNV